MMKCDSCGSKDMTIGIEPSPHDPESCAYFKKCLEFHCMRVDLISKKEYYAKKKELDAPVEYPEVYSGYHGFGNTGRGPKYFFTIKIGWAGNFKTSNMIKDSFRYAYLKSLNESIKSAPLAYKGNKELVIQPIAKLSLSHDFIDVEVNNENALTVSHVYVQGFSGVEK